MHSCIAHTQRCRMQATCAPFDSVPQVLDAQEALGVAHTIPIAIRGEAYKIEVDIKFPQDGLQVPAALRMCDVIYVNMSIVLHGQLCTVLIRTAIQCLHTLPHSPYPHSTTCWWSSLNNPMHLEHVF